MSFEDRQRLSDDLCNPRIVQLHMALARLRSCLKFMNSGAHPDDETSAMLAALAYRDGLDISYACANRGEGGQNEIGTESGAVLGTLRTAEMEQAAKVLDLRLYWLSAHPKDSIVDFGFSKSGQETLSKWGYERTLQRFVSIVRREQPDILCPTFLDIPGQHGHHRAMTLMAHAVMERAADKNYRIDHSNDPAWQISKLFLPAWGGGGNAYDDEEPPPRETLRIPASDRDPVTGWSWENLGQQSRKYHLTQGMGRWIFTGEERDWPLHLAATTLDESSQPSASLSSGLVSDFEQWAKRAGTDRSASRLMHVHEMLSATIQAFPDFRAVTEFGFAAVSAMTQAQNGASPVLQNRLACKQAQVARVLMLASGIKANAWTKRILWRPGDSAKIRLDVNKANVPGVQCDIKMLDSYVPSIDSPWTIDDNILSLSTTASPDTPYPETWFADEPFGPVVELSLVRDGVKVRYSQQLEVPPVVLPPVSAQLAPEVALVNLKNPCRELNIRVHRRHPENATASFTLPNGWTQKTTDNQLTLRMPSTLEPGLYELPLELDRCPAESEQLISYSHIDPRVYCQPATLRVRAISVELPDVRIGYVGGGNDKVAPLLRAMGFAVHEITDEELLDPASLKRALQIIDTLVIGVFAYKTRTLLAPLSVTINKWVEQGGHLLTLYHRPWDNWNPESTPPARLEIGKPSLRFRVTNENAEIRYLQASHPLLNHPNIIQDADWRGWKKERGLYFAKSWDSAYTPLISMNDPGELSHEGALLVANIGKGRHVHTSLILHYQMDELVPGAFRIIANLLS